MDLYHYHQLYIEKFVFLNNIIIYFHHLQHKKVEIEGKIKATQDPNQIKPLQTELHNVNNQIRTLQDKVVDAKNRAHNLHNNHNFQQRELWTHEQQWRTGLSLANNAKYARDKEDARANEYENKGRDEQNIATNYRKEETNLRNTAQTKRTQAGGLIEEVHQFEIEGPQQVQQGKKDLNIEQTNLKSEQNHLKDLEKQKANLPAGSPANIKKAEQELKEARNNQTTAVQQAEDAVTQKEVEYKEGVTTAQGVVDKYVKEREEGMAPLQQKLDSLEQEHSNTIQQREKTEKKYDQKYMDKEIGKIKDTWWNLKSDDQVRELITKNRSFAGEIEKIYPNATVEQKIKMITIMLKGFTFDADEQAILKLLHAAKERGELDAILDNPKTSAKKLNKKINGAENKELHKIIDN